MRIPQAQYDELIAHARDDAPNECCGVIAARDGLVEQVYRVKNAQASPLRYALDDLDSMRVYEEIDAKGQQQVAVYHSHTRSAAYPSQTDINLAFFPDQLYVIISLAEAEAPDVKAFRIVDRKVSEVELQIV